MAQALPFVSAILPMVTSLFGGKDQPTVPKTPEAPVANDKEAQAKRLRDQQRRAATVGREGTALTGGTQSGLLG